MALYDLMLLLDPTAPSDRHETILNETQKLIESGGKTVGTYDWGTRRMAFEIDHRPEAAYHLIQFETDQKAVLLDRLDHSLKIMDGVLRHRIIRLKDGSPPPPVPRPEGRREVVEAAAENGGGAPPAEGVPAEAAVPAEAVPAEAGGFETAPAAPAEPAEVASAPADEPATPPAEEAADTPGDETPPDPAAA
jgi:small subunit ribosomal protein S6